jgi:hypothetical protein
MTGRGPVAIRWRIAIGMGSAMLLMLACNLPSTATAPALQLPPTVTTQPLEPVAALPSSVAQPSTPAPPTPLATEAGTVANGSPSADLQLMDLSLTAGGNIAVHVENAGRDDLEQTHVMLSLQIGGGGATAGPHGPTRMWITLKSGGSLALDTGVTADLSQGDIQVTASMIPEDFQDPNGSNNQVTKSFAGLPTPTVEATSSTLQIGTMMPVISADIELYAAVNTTSGNVMQLQINNNGPSDLKGAGGSFTCYVTYRKTGASAWTQVGNTGNIALNLPAGKGDLYGSGILLPWDDIHGQINCTVSADVLDPVPGNNSWASSIH